MSSEEFNDLALSFPGTPAHPHFDRIAFKVEGKKYLRRCTKKVNWLILFCPFRNRNYFVK